MQRVERSGVWVWDVYFDLGCDRKPSFTKWCVFVQKVENAVFGMFSGLR